jgi:hypothetical protein
MRPLSAKALQARIDELGALYNKKVDEIEGLTKVNEHFLESDRIALEVLGELIPKVADCALRSRLQVVEDILDGACTRYTDK